MHAHLAGFVVDNRVDEREYRNLQVCRVLRFVQATGKVPYHSLQAEREIVIVTRVRVCT